MNNKLNNVSMLGRMAYTIMCVEAFLKNCHGDRDWSPVATAMWKATSTNWGDWPEEYSAYIPDVLLSYDGFEDELAETKTEGTYQKLLRLYNGITEGSEDDPTDEVNYMLNLPHEMAMIYEGTIIGDGKESFDIVNRAEKILDSHNIPYPDYHKVLFSSAAELNGWGNFFNGANLSIIL